MSKSVRECTLEELMPDLEHLLGCEGRYGICAARMNVHRWPLETWAVVWEKIDERVGNGKGYWEVDQSTLHRRLEIASRATRCMGRLLEEYERERERVLRRVEKLEVELAQLQAGHLHRTRDEILAAAGSARQLSAATGVALRRQYAAARIAEALLWAIERPETETVTQFRPKRDDATGIA